MFSVIEDRPPGLELVHTLRASKGGVGRLEWSRDGKIITAPYKDGSISFWNVENGKLMHSLRKHSRRAVSVAWSRDGKNLASASDDNTIIIWEPEEKKAAKIIDGHSGSVNFIAWSHDDKTLVSASQDRTIRFWDRETWEQKYQQIKIETDPTDIAWSPDDKFVAVLQQRSHFEIWDVEKNEIHKELKGPRGAITSVLWAENGSLFTGSEEGSILKWNIDEGMEEYILKGHDNLVNSLSLSPDQKLLASRSMDDSVRIWNLDTKEQVVGLRIQGHHFSISGIAFHPSDPVLATLDKSDTAIRVWNVDTGILS